MSYIEVNIVRDEPEKTRTFWEHPVLALGFRPFFLAGAALGAVWLVIWLLAFAGKINFGSYGIVMGWHAHEMLFGFTVAIIAGFLLTAVQNWTGVKMPHGRGLAALVGLWLAGRVAMLVGATGFLSVPPIVILLIDMAFLPALAYAIGRAIIGTKNKRNMAFIGLISLLAVANLIFHLDVIGVLPLWGTKATNLALHLIVVIMAVIGGRVVPMFTRNALGDDSIRKWPFVDKLSVGLIAALVFVDLVWTNSALSGWIALVAGFATLVRMRSWGSWKTHSVPLLWVLHVGFIFIPIGLLLKSLALNFDLIALGASTHALTVGAIGALTLGMMARVALGHTGRPLVASRTMTIAFALLSVAALVRVATPIIATPWYLYGVVVSGVLWTIAFTLYFIFYWPILTRPRADGRAG